MATSTTNLGLTKPSVNDAADIAVLNANFDKIDEKCNPALFAPSGYGLGAHGIYCSDCNSATKNGWYRFDASTMNIAPSASQGSLFVRNAESSSGVIVHQTLWNGYWRAYRFYGPWDNTWTEWEFENPPMQPGVEYCTTERFWGKPVYCKLVDCGVLPNASTKLVYYADNGVVNHIVRYSGEMFASGDTFSMPYTMNGVEVCVQAISRTGINLYASYNASGFEAYVTVWYIKN